MQLVQLLGGGAILVLACEYNSTLNGRQSRVYFVDGRALVHESSPSLRDNTAVTASLEGGGSVHPTAPVSDDAVLVLPKQLGRVGNDRSSFASISKLVEIATDGCNT